MISNVSWERPPWKVLWKPIQSEIAHHPTFVDFSNPQQSYEGETDWQARKGTGKGWIVWCPEHGVDGWIRAIRRGGEVWCPIHGYAVTWVREAYRRWMESEEYRRCQQSNTKKNRLKQ